ncbi:MAG TPA: winged helix DNA-binding protein [Allosphingosinicella sp.]|nr:winged helix DNA-binding protein [Allosphingosinicella sp.]
MPEDFVRSLGLPFMAHRLRRLSELILEGSSAVLREAGLEGPARAGSTLLLLRENGPTGITEIAFRLRLSHPLIIKLTAALAAAGLVSDESDPADSRRRLIALTDKGAAEAARIERVSTALGRTFAAMFEETGTDLYAALERFEAAAEARPIAARLQAELQKEGEYS